MGSWEDLGLGFYLHVRVLYMYLFIQGESADKKLAPRKVPPFASGVRNLNREPTLQNLLVAQN